MNFRSKHQTREKGRNLNFFFACFFISLFLITTFNCSVFHAWNQSAAESVASTVTGSAQIATLPQNFTEPVVSANFAVLMDARTGQILYKKKENEKAYPASITKIMTALVAIENSKKEDVIVMSHDAVFGIERDSTHIALQVGEEITMDQALYALLLASANDAANGIAEKVGGTVENFAVMMTDRAKKIGAMNTNFTNPHGLPDDNHYTTAYDMALITREAIQNETFLSYFSTIQYTMQSTNMQKEQRYFLNHNKLLYNSRYFYEPAIGGKTGYTSKAGSTLVTVAEKDGRRLICVTLKETAVEAYADTKTLFEYGFSKFTPILIPAGNLTKPGIPVSENSKNIGTADIKTTEDVTLWIPSGSSCDPSATAIHIPQTIEVKAGETTADLAIRAQIPELDTPFYETTLTLPYHVPVTLYPVATPTPDSSELKGGMKAAGKVIKYVLAGLLGLVVLYVFYVVFMIFRLGYYRKIVKRFHKKMKNRRHAKIQKYHEKFKRTPRK